MTNIEPVKHSDIEPMSAPECDGPLISVILGQVKCGKCGKHVRAEAVRTAQDRIEDHQTFYGLALVLVYESEGS